MVVLDKTTQLVFKEVLQMIQRLAAFTLTLFFVLGVGGTAMLQSTSSLVVQVVPSALDFSAKTPVGPDSKLQPISPKEIKLEIINTNPVSSVPWRVETSVPWLQVQPMSGEAPKGKIAYSQTLNVAVNIESLAVGTYEGTITIKAVDVRDNYFVPVPVSVKLEVPNPDVQFQPLQPFTSTLLGPQPPAQKAKLVITNYSTQRSSWKAIASVPALQIQPAMGEVPSRQQATAELSVSVNIDDLAKGTYTSQIKLEITGAKPVEVPARIEIKDPLVLGPLETIVIGGAKIGGLDASADGKVVFVAASVGRESAVFVIALDTKTKKFFGKKTRGCPAEDEACLLFIRGLINPKDMTYCDAKKLLFIPGYDDNTLYISEVVFKDGVPTEAKAAKKVTVGQGPKAVAVTDDCNRAVIANEMAHTASVVDVSDPGKPTVIATVDLWPDKTASPPSPADVAIQGDTAYVVLTDVWQVASIVNIKGPAAGIKVGTFADTGGAYPRALALSGGTVYVANSNTDNVSLLSTMNLQPSKVVRVGDTNRNITTDGQWVLTSNAGVDETDFTRSGGPTITCLRADGARVLTTTVKLDQDDSMVPEAILMAPSGETSNAAWVVNIGSRGEVRIYDMAKLCPSR